MSEGKKQETQIRRWLAFEWSEGGYGWVHERILTIRTPWKAIVLDWGSVLPDVQHGNLMMRKRVYGLRGSRWLRITNYEKIYRFTMSASTWTPCIPGSERWKNQQGFWAQCAKSKRVVTRSCVFVTHEDFTKAREQRQKTAPNPPFGHFDLDGEKETWIEDQGLDN